MIDWIEFLTLLAWPILYLVPVSVSNSYALLEPCCARLVTRLVHFDPLPAKHIASQLFFSFPTRTRSTTRKVLICLPSTSWMRMRWERTNTSSLRAKTALSVCQAICNDFWGPFPSRSPGSSFSVFSFCRQVWNVTSVTAWRRVCQRVRFIYN